jgi:hypothetical protein
MVGDIGMLGPIGGVIKAYHGSPHKFDKFDLSKIGTGEGAQAYGHGLYFAEDPRVAEVYKNALSKSEIADASGKALYTPAPKGNYSRAGSAEERAMSALQYAHDTQSSAPYRLARDLLRRTDNKAEADEALAMLNKWQEAGATPRPMGALYETNIRWPDPAREAADPLGPQHFLDWDKPLTKQPENVRSAIDDFTHDRGSYTGSDWSAYFGEPRDGASVIEAMSRALGSTNKASEYLRGYGIPGIRYLDAGSRATSGGELLDVFKDAAGKWRSKIKVTNRGGNGFMAPTDSVTTSTPFDTADAARAWAQNKIEAGTANYVVFDDALIEILKRNGMTP